MKLLRTLLVLGFISAASLSIIGQEKPPIPLSADPTTAIITMDSHGTYTVGRTLSAPPIPQGPLLTIYASGETTVIVRNGNSPQEIRRALLPSEVQQLLHFAIDEQNFFALSGTDIQKAVTAENKRLGIGYGVGDAIDTVIRIKTADKENEVHFYAINEYAQAYPSIKALQQLQALQSRLERVYQELAAGSGTVTR